MGIKNIFGGMMGKELTPTEKICPILAMRGGPDEPLSKCVGKKCMWFHGKSDKEVDGGKCAISDFPGYLSDLLELVKQQSE